MNVPIRNNSTAIKTPMLIQASKVNAFVYKFQSTVSLPLLNINLNCNYKDWDLLSLYETCKKSTDYKPQARHL